MTLIKIENLIINIALLVEAQFQPASTGIDEETGEPRIGIARLYLRFAAPESQPNTDYNGDYTGASDHSPYCRLLLGEDAESVWGHLCKGASHL